MQNFGTMFSLTLLLSLWGMSNATEWYAPQQVHIATGSSSEMIIVWNTLSDTNDSRVIYGVDRFNMDMLTLGNRTKFWDGGPDGSGQYVHVVTLTGLKPNTAYYYVVGSQQFGLSDVLSFKTWPAGNSWSPSLAVYGDLGNENPKSLFRLEEEANRGMYDAILHVGDFAYNMEYDSGRVGDAFMRQIEPLASQMPYLTCPGNHESYDNFSNYKHRFRMPGDLDQRMYYSIKMGPIRLISTSTEYIFYPEYGIEPPINHYNWLVKELQDANKPENRAQQPWVITMGHRPMYCTNIDHDDCNKYESVIRNGIAGFLGWEKQFYEYGVDLAIWAHEHSYERLWPVYNRKVMNGSYFAPYTNPRAPVHITTGSAGCGAQHDPFNKTDQAWSAFRSEDYGYTKLKVYNSTHLSIQQVSDDKGGAIIDKFMIIKDRHGSYGYNPSPNKPVGNTDKLWKNWRKFIKPDANDLP